MLHGWNLGFVYFSLYLIASLPCKRLFIHATSKVNIMAFKVFDVLCGCL